MNLPRPINNQFLDFLCLEVFYRCEHGEVNVPHKIGLFFRVAVMATQEH